MLLLLPLPLLLLLLLLQQQQIEVELYTGGVTGMPFGSPVAESVKTLYSSWNTRNNNSLSGSSSSSSSSSSRLTAAMLNGRPTRKVTHCRITSMEKSDRCKSEFRMGLANPRVESGRVWSGQVGSGQVSTKIGWSNRVRSSVCKYNFFEVIWPITAGRVGANIFFYYPLAWLGRIQFSVDLWVGRSGRIKRNGLISNSAVNAISSSTTNRLYRNVVGGCSKQEQNLSGRGHWPVMAYNERTGGSDKIGSCS